jgi:pantothenate kinase
LIVAGFLPKYPHDPEKREALFDLLTLSIYADAHVSLTEERLVESAFIAKGWESEYPKSLFIEESFARAREAADSDDAMFDYINEKAQVFTTKAAQKEALGALPKVTK